MNQFLTLLIDKLQGLVPGSNKLNERLKVFIFIAGALVFLTSTLAVQHYAASRVYVVSMNGVELGTVCDARDVEMFIDDLIFKCSALYGMELQLADRITMSREYRTDCKPDLAIVNDAIRDQASFITTAYLLHIDGRPFAQLPSEEGLDELVLSLKSVYSEKSDPANLQDVMILEELDLEASTAAPESLYTTEELIALLTDDDESDNPALYASSSFIVWPGSENREVRDIFSRGTTEQDEQTSEKNITINEETKPASKSDESSIIKIHVQIVEEITVKEIIPFPVETVENNNMLVNERDVITPGTDGEKEVTYRIVKENGIEVERSVVSENVLLEPEIQVEAVGTKPVPLPSGATFLWPVQGEGMIMRGFTQGHSGVDIHIATGSNVLAAADGVVTFSGWGGTQGNYLIIHHGAYWTLYLHNSENLVKQGERVRRGQVIAKVGSTGRSTGPHLHFEVRVDDGSRQWLSYYQHQPIDPLQFFNRKLNN